MSRSRPLVLSFALITLGACAGTPPEERPAQVPAATSASTPPRSTAIAVVEIPRAPTSDVAEAQPTASARTAPEAPPEDVPWPTFTRPPRDAAPSARTSKGYSVDAISVVNAMQPLFRKCYDRALRDERGLTGNARLSIEVGPKGYVESVKVLESSGLPKRLTDCCMEAALSQMFPAHGTPAIEVVAPIAFQKN